MKVTARLTLLGSFAAMMLGGCQDTTRELAGGNQIDALQRVKTAAAQAGAQAQDRFKLGLKEGSSDADIEAATGEKAP